MMPTMIIRMSNLMKIRNECFIYIDYEHGRVTVINDSKSVDRITFLCTYLVIAHVPRYDYLMKVRTLTLSISSS